MLRYAIFFSEAVSRRKKIGRGEQIILNEKCSAVISRRVPPKLKDPKRFTILIEIGGLNLGKPFVTLGITLTLCPCKFIVD